MYRKCFWWPVFVLLQILQTGNTGDATVLHIESLDKESLQDNRARVNSAPDIGKFDWKHLSVLKIIITVILLLFYYYYFEVAHFCHDWCSWFV